MNANRSAPQDSFQAINPKPVLIAGFASLLTVSILILIKAIAYWQSGSASVLASLIDSVIDFGLSLMTLFAVQYSLKPPDHEHRYGHGKIEGVVALFQAAFIAGAGMSLFLESFRRITHPQEVVDHDLAIIVMLISAILTLVLVFIQKYTLKKMPSLAIEADKSHYFVDILINAGVIATLIALSSGAPVWIDSAFAILIAFYLGFTVRSIALKGLDMLLDKELSGTIREQIITLVLKHEGVLGLHDLRTNQSGLRYFISFDIEVDDEMSLLDSHQITKDLEAELIALFPLAEVMIHVDPKGDTEDARHIVSGVHV